MYNGELQTIDTQEKAYLLGQLWGDGCNSYSKSYKICLASNDKDEELYQKLNYHFPFLHLTHYPSHSNMVYLVNNQKALFLDLKSLGLLSKKSEKDITGEFHFPILNEELIPHFIRGYFDADGSAWYPKRKRSRNNLHIEFGCATKNFLLEIKKILDSKGIYFTYTEREKKAGNGKRYKSYILYSSNSSISRKFADYIYNEAHLYLDYKKYLCYKQPDLRPSNYSIFGNCPHCNSTHIIKNGTRNGKVRLKCKNCNKHFTLPMPK